MAGGPESWFLWKRWTCVIMTSPSFEGTAFLPGSKSETCKYNLKVLRHIAH